MSKNLTATTGTTRRSPLITHYTLFAAAAAAIMMASALCAEGKYREAAAAGLAILAVGYILSAGVSIESVLIFWFATEPLASFYVRFPLDKSIITYNRAIIALVLLMLLLKSLTKNSARFPVTKFEIAGALVSVLALASAVIQSNDVTYAAKLAIDAFLLPLIIFNLARHRFDARGRAGALMLSAIALSLFLFSTGAYEFVTGTNLFQYKGSELIREGERRVNGPFTADSSYAIICLFLAFFLQAAPQLLRVKSDKTTRLLYSCAFTAAVVASLLSLFRATAIALVTGFIIVKIAGRKNERAPRPRFSASPIKVWGIAVVTAIIISAMSLGYFSFGGRLTNPRNAFGRLATWETAAGITMDNPLSGVGLANYRDYFHARYAWEDESVERVMSTRAADSPHSNLFWIAAELGVFAFALYIAANIYLFSMGWRALRKAADLQEKAAAACYLALFVAYWIHGLTLASGYYSDTNLYFFFMLGLLSNKSLVSGS
ncbi:MAG: O-antigen ligase family protein [Blastocatellia bacterium]